MRTRNGRFQGQVGGRSKTFDSKAEAERWEAGVRHGFIQFDTSSTELPATVGDMLDYTYNHRWAGLKSEEDLYRNGQHVAEALGLDAGTISRPRARSAQRPSTGNSRPSQP